MLSRRTLMLAAAGTTIAQTAQALVPTPRQPAGPFFPDRLPPESDFDLTRIGAGAPADGEVIELIGRVLGPDGRALPQAVVELWQANAYGRYGHSRDRSNAPLDPNFQGYGVVRTDAEGRYRFRTVRPGLYAGRTRHIHFYIAGPGFERMPTQMYFADEPNNDRDGLYNAIRDPAMREAVTVDLSPTGAGVPVGQFDIVLGRG